MALATYGLGTAVFVGLLLWQAGDLKLALLTAGGFLGGFAVFALVGWLALLGCAAARRVDATRAGASPSPRCSAAPAPPSCRWSRCRWA
jgi:predicted lysophospholipase L1 biosynthesis ABC-type transport system permease subunit